MWEIFKNWIRLYDHLGQLLPQVLSSSAPYNIVFSQFEEFDYRDHLKTIISIHKYDFPNIGDNQ